MGLILNKLITTSTIRGSKEENADVYYRPVSIYVDANLDLCKFVVEGRVKDIHGKLISQETHEIEIDKTKDLFQQIYSYIKSLEQYADYKDAL